MGAGNGKQLRHFGSLDRPIHCFAFSPEGSILITGSQLRDLSLWDVGRGTELRSLKNPGYWLGRIVVSPNGELIAAAGDDVVEVGIQLWDLANRKPGPVLSRTNFSMAFFSPDSKGLFTAGWDVKERAGILSSWDAATGKERQVLARHTNAFDEAALSADAKVFAASDPEKTLRAWDTASGKVLLQVPPDRLFQRCFALSPDSKLLASADGWRPISSDQVERSIHLWDIRTGKMLSKFGRSDGSYSQNGYQAIAFSSDGRTLATAGDGNRIRLWEVATGSERLALEGHAGRVLQFVLAEHGTTLITASADTTALVWDLTGLRTHRDHAQQPTALPELWTALADANAARAYQAIWCLVATPPRTVAFLAERLHPVHSPNEKIAARLVADLDSPVYLTRQKATQQLSQFDLLAEPVLRKALAGHPSLELQQRLQQLLEHLQGPPSGELLQSLRAVEALEVMSTPPARRLLQELVNGAPAARFTQEAKASLERLAQRSRDAP